MTDEIRPLEETPEVASAVEDDVTVPQFVTGGGPDDDNPVFVAPGERPELDRDGPAAIEGTVP